MSLLDLPAELLAHIISFLNPHAVLKLSHTCWRMRKAGLMRVCKDLVVLPCVPASPSVPCPFFRVRLLEVGDADLRYFAHVDILDLYTRVTDMGMIHLRAVKI